MPPAKARPLSRLYWSVIICTLFAGLLAITTVATSVLRQSEDEWVRHTLAVRTRIVEVVALVQRAEFGQRGYLLTGRDSYLTPYEQAATRLPAAIDALSNLVADNKVQVQSVARLRQLTHEKLDELKRTTDARQNGATDDALRLVNNDTGLRLMDDIRSLTGVMDQEESNLLRDRQARATMFGSLVQIGAGAAFLLICVAAAIGALLTRRSFGELTAAHDELVSTNALLVQQINRREIVESQLRQSQKMEAIGQLSGGIAHDFNNMIGVIAGSLDLVKRRIAKNDFVIERYVDAAQEAAKRSAALTQRLLAFARQQPLDPKPIDANRMIGAMSELLRSTLGEQIHVETVSFGGLWLLKADASQLENVILNVAINARDAMPEGGKLTIETGNAFLDDEYAKQNVDVKPGQYVMVAVSDTGSGMDAATIARAFDPFFTTKRPGTGTGLGLSQVYGFIKQTGGYVKIYSEVGTGTTIKLYLPRFSEKIAAVAVEETTQVNRGNAHEVVLVVEDDALMRRTSTDALRELGYTAIHTAGAAQALSLLDLREDVSLLFTDIVMPDVNGKKLADEALRRRPDIKVLFTTGYTKNAVVHGGVLDPGTQLLAKPFTLHQLAEKVRAVLDRA